MLWWLGIVRAVWQVTGARAQFHGPNPRTGSHAFSGDMAANAATSHLPKKVARSSGPLQRICPECASCVSNGHSKADCDVPRLALSQAGNRPIRGPVAQR